MLKPRKIVTVKNKKGTFGRRPPNGCNSWLEFWEDKTGRKAKRCANLECGNKEDLVGGHVYHVYIVGTTAKEYIVPLCKNCNNAPEGKEFEVYKDDLVPVRGENNQS